VSGRGGRVTTVEEAAAWVDAVGLALLYPNPDYVLPSLWEAVAGRVPVEWAVRDADGTFVSFTPEMDRVWGWKDVLPARRLACIGLHVARTSSLVAPRLVAPLYALTGRRGAPDDFRDGELSELERTVAEALLEHRRPATRRELRLLAGAEKRHVDRAVNALQRKLVLTNAGSTSAESGWASTLHDLFARRWRARLRRLPARERAVQRLAEAVLLGTEDVSAADLAAALRVRRREATSALEALEGRGTATARSEEGILLWSAA
jgi:chromosome segregation and condensation protein ScpB